MQVFTTVPLVELRRAGELFGELEAVGYDLGLGSQIRPHITRRYSMPWSKPAARMHEMVRAIRAIWDRWDGIADLDFRGEFYTHSLMAPVFVPGPHRYGRARVHVAGVGPALDQGIAAAARDRADVVSLECTRRPDPTHFADIVRAMKAPAA